MCEEWHLLLLLLLLHQGRSWHLFISREWCSNCMSNLSRSIAGFQCTSYLASPDGIQSSCDHQLRYFACDKEVRMKCVMGKWVGWATVSQLRVAAKFPSSFALTNFILAHITTVKFDDKEANTQRVRARSKAKKSTGMIFNLYIQGSSQKIIPDRVIQK